MPVLAALVAFGIAGCGSPPTPAPAATSGAAAEPVVEPRRDDSTSALWALAPPHATIGIVVGDGAPGRITEAMSALAGAVGPELRASFLEGFEEGSGARLALDVLDPAVWSEVGFDPARGAAIFGRPTDDLPALLILPVGDRAAFVERVGARLPDQGGRTLDQVGPLVCTEARGRYLCAPDLDALGAALQPSSSPLAAGVARLEPRLRGDVELYALGPAIDIGWRPFDIGSDGVAVSARLDRGGITLRGVALGTPLGGVDAVRATAPTPAIVELARRAIGLSRLHLDPQVLFTRVPEAAVGDASLRADLVDQLTGDFFVVSAGRGLVSAALHAGIVDPAPVERFVAAVCRAGTGLGPVSPIRNVALEGAACTARLSMVGPRGEMWPAMPLRLEVGERTLVLSIGEVVSAADDTTLDLAGSDAAREVIARPQSLSLWTTGLDGDIYRPELSVGGVALASLERGDTDLEQVQRILAQVYELALGVAASGQGVEMLVRVTTFGADPPAARAAYADALELRWSGRLDEYRAALERIEADHPGSLLARRARRWRAGSRYIDAASTAFAVMFAGLLLPAWIDPDPPAAP
jgi:hypothetical protein